MKWTRTLRYGIVCRSLLQIFAIATVLLHSAGANGSAIAAGAPNDLRIDSVVTPLGIDSQRPQFSWKLQDERHGARQTAYQIIVLTSVGKAEAPVWDSGKVMSDASVHVAYGGAALEPFQRYLWRVRVWGRDGVEYPESKATWWEAGLLGGNWRGQWIGYEPRELHAVRESAPKWITSVTPPDFKSPGDTHHAFRLTVQLDQKVKRAVLYAAGEFNVAAWVNQTAALAFEPIPAWGMLPWATYRKADVTVDLHPGRNILSVEVNHFDRSGGKAVNRKGAAMSMSLYLEMADGTERVVNSNDPGWRAQQEPLGNWQSAEFDDSRWQAPEQYRSDPRGAAGLPWQTGPVSIVRRGFVENTKIVSARLYATALGAYKFHLNGTPVGDQILAPGWTDYRERVTYQVYDVTGQVHVGRNEIAALLAPGWYSTRLMDQGRSNNYGATQPSLKAMLRIEHADGSIEWIASDGTWEGAISATSEAEIYNGESFDARRNIKNWDNAESTEAKWDKAMVVTPREPQVVVQDFPPIRAEQILTAKTITEPRPATYVYDFGQDMAAVPRVRIIGAAGQRIQLRFAEVLNADGTIYTANLRNAKATDSFTLAGTGSAEEWQPQFTYHGFRYIEVTGLANAPDLAAVKAVVLHTDATPTLELHTSNALVQQIWSNIEWGQRSNFMSVPTDCPQRDERLGWTADAQVFWRTASYNWDLTAFSRKYADDLRGTQVGTKMYGSFAPGTMVSNWPGGAGWSDAGVIIPWTSWLQSGDRIIVDQNWDAMDSYLQSILSSNPNHLWRKAVGTPYGDWLSPTISTPEDLIATAYWAYDSKLMQQMAIATGRAADAAHYGTLYASIREAFIRAYVKPGGVVGEVDDYPSLQHRVPPPNPDGSRPLIETQTGYVLALYMGLLPEDQRKQAADKLVTMIETNHGLLGTGFLGTPYLMEVLSATGHSDVAYRVLLNKEYPSWGYLVEHGATTTWERWNGDKMRDDPSMNSYNHYAYGAVGEWLYRDVAGIDTTALDAGFHTILLHPHFDRRLGDLRLRFNSPYGPVLSDWTIRGDDVVWKVIVPPNAHAELSGAVAEHREVAVDGKPLSSSPQIHALPSGDFELIPGTYTFTMRLAHEGSGRQN